MYQNNDEITEFINKSQNKIADLATLIVERGGYIPDSLTLLIELSDFVECLQYESNNSTIEDILQWIHEFNYRADLNSIPYNELEGFQSIIMIGSSSTFVEDSLTDHPNSTTTAPSIRAVNQALLSMGAGDMLKSVYDINNNGIVDDSEKLGTQLPAYYLSQDNMVDGTTNKNYTSTEKTKLAGIAPNATANIGDVTLNGTQTLTNKTISGSNNTLSNIPESAVTNLVTDLGNKVNIDTSSTITFGSTIALDFNAATVQTLAITGNTTFITSTNKAQFKYKRITISNSSGVDYTVTFNTSWNRNVASLLIPTGKKAMLSVECTTGNAETDIWSGIFLAV